MPRDDVQRAVADRTGGAEHRDAFHGPNSEIEQRFADGEHGQRRSNTLSRRSNMPPWPGNSAAGILYAGLALDQAFVEIADDRRPDQDEREAQSGDECATPRTV